MTNKDNPMMEKYSTVSWCPADVKELTGWSNEKCMEALNTIAPYLEDRLIELGFETIEVLLNIHFDREEEDEYEDA